MRFPTTSLLFALCATVVSGSAGKVEKGKSAVLEPTVFNGVEVPPLTEIEGPKFNATIKDGWWLVKHHS